MKKRVLVAMSGGVDSSVAAAMVAERGDEAVGVTMKLLARAETGFGCCGSPADVDDAKRVAEKLRISHYVSDMAEIFESKVIRPYLDAYLGGTTPNPCVECNRSLKFGHLLGLAAAWGCDAVATGHYARVIGGVLHKSLDQAKDQSYFLYSLDATARARADFPVGSLSKDAVRAKARELGLKTADKPESMETCFVPDRDVRGFVAAHADASAPGLASGPIRDRSGRVLGQHTGLASYTIGQRSGLGLSGPEPRYVVRIDAKENAVIVGSTDELQTREITVGAMTLNGERNGETFQAEVRIRHRHVPTPSTITLHDGTATITFHEPQRAPAPGQAAVFYDNEAVIGGGTILRAGGAS
ncbi:MAG: tRNA 2-thiouridine(34) synthase MnmA [Elusimicrobia bacterium]|nr:tRNA 2-thiouridine(34) synthase MnmA [Elusimicrobiota bacterium]